MKTIKLRGIGISRNTLLALAIAALVVVPVLLTGCQNSDSRDTSGLASSSDVAYDVEPLTLAAVSAKVSMNSDQQSQLKDALATYNREREARLAARSAGNLKAGMPPMGESPMMTLLKDCSEFLDTKQMTSLATAINAQRTSAFKNRTRPASDRGPGMRRGDHGPGPGNMLDSLKAQLGLTDDQVEAIKALHEQRREEFQMRRHGATRGERPAINDEDGRPDFHQQMREELAKILTDEQLQKLDDLQEARRAEHQARMLEFAQERLDNRTDFMATVLKLDTGQKSQLEAIFTKEQEQRQQLHENIGNGTLDRKEIRELMPQLREQTESEIRDLLTDEQVALFDALQDLMPHGARRGPRPL